MSGTQRLEVTGDKFRRTEGSAKQHQAAGCGFKRLVTEPHATVRLDILQAVRGADDRNTLQLRTLKRVSSEVCWAL